MSMPRSSTSLSPLTRPAASSMAHMANNKRRRNHVPSSLDKDSSLPPTKRQTTTLNGVYHDGVSSVPKPNSVGKKITTSHNATHASAVSAQQTHDSNIVKAKMAQIGRSKVKTIQEILEDLQDRGGEGLESAPRSATLEGGRPRIPNQLLDCSSPHQASWSEKERGVELLSLSAEGEKPSSMAHRSVEEILAMLPPLNASTVVWSDQEEGERRVEQVPELVLQSVMSGEGVEGLTGNMSCWTKTEDTTSQEQNRTQFREWHQTVWKESYANKPLLVWPYVIKD